MKNSEIKNEILGLDYGSTLHLTSGDTKLKVWPVAEGKFSACRTMINENTGKPYNQYFSIWENGIDHTVEIFEKEGLKISGITSI